MTNWVRVMALPVSVLLPERDCRAWLAV